MLQLARRTLFLAMLVVAPLALPAQKTWHLVEELRIGGAESGPTSFSEIRDIAVDPRGQIFVLDSKAKLIRLFDAAGKFVRQVGRDGAGPGEYRDPNGMRLSPDGALWVNDYNNARFDVFKPTGAFDRQVLAETWGYSYAWNGEIDAKGRLMEIVPGTVNGARVGVLRRFDPKIAKWDTIPIPLCSVPKEAAQTKTSWSYRTATGGGIISVPFASRAIGRLDPAGSWWCTTAQSYRIKQVQLADGKELTDISRNDPQVALSSLARDSAIEQLKKSMKGVPPDAVDFSMIPHTQPRFNRLAFDDMGRVWVFRPGVAGPAIDVWSRRGDFLGTMASPRPMFEGLPVIIRGDRLYTVMTDGDDLPFVVRYRIQQ